MSDPRGRRTLVAVAALLLAAGAVAHQATMGFRVLTSESARRLAVAREPRELPQARLADGHRFAETLRADGRVVLVDFIYTRCESLCTALGTDYQQLQREITRRGLGDRVRLLSLSFDPTRDDAATLALHQQRLRADPAIWQASTVPDPEELGRLLDAVGIVVLPDGRGDFVHNAAIHVVGPDGRLRGIHDLGRWRAALRDALRAPP